MIETPRLILRPWAETDKPRFHEIVNTPAMMEHFGGPADKSVSDAIIDREMARQERDGHCMWAVTLKDGTLAGVCGVRINGYPDTPVPDELEIGWRIGEAWWGQGVAREAAEASIAWGWAHTARPRIVAWTSIGNTRSWGLMRRLGMDRREDLDFRHPNVADPVIGAMIVYSLERPS